MENMMPHPVFSPHINCYKRFQSWCYFVQIAFLHERDLESNALYSTTCDEDRNKLQGLLLEETLLNLMKHELFRYKRESPDSKGCHNITPGRKPCEFPPNVVFQTSWAWKRICTKTRSVELPNRIGHRVCEVMWHRQPHHSPLRGGYFWDVYKLVAQLLCFSVVQKQGLFPLCFFTRANEF